MYILCSHGVDGPMTRLPAVILDQPGFQSCGASGIQSTSLGGQAPLVAVYGQNAFDEFAINFTEDILHSYVQRYIFEDSVIALPQIQTMDNMACVDCLEAPKLSSGSSGNRVVAWVSSPRGDLATKFGVHTSFVASPSVSGQADRTLFGINLYAGQVSYDITRFIEKDADLLDSAFVPLLRNSTEAFVAKLFSGPSLAAEKHRRPGAEEAPKLDRQKTYPSDQLCTIKPPLHDRECPLVDTLVYTSKRLWVVQLFRQAPCQGTDLLLLTPGLASWRSADAQWKMVEDPLRAHVKHARRMMADDEDGSVAPDDGTEYTHREGQGLMGESADDLLLTRTGTNATQYRDPNVGPYAQGGLHTPNMADGARGSDSRGGGDDGWNDSTQWYVKESQHGDAPAYTALGKEGLVVVKDAPNVVEEVPTLRTRRCAQISPSRGAKKLTIFWLILLFNGIIIFYIVEFGKLLCPKYDNAWATNEVAQHTANNDCDVTGMASNGFDTLESLAGTDMTYYFPVPLTFRCDGLVSDDILAITPKNFTDVAPTADHTSGKLTSYTDSQLANMDWYTNTFQPKMKKYLKGPLVWDPSTIEADAQSQEMEKIWGIYENNVYDLTDYFSTQTTFSTSTDYKFLSSDVEDVFKQQSGQDVTKPLKEALAGLNSTYQAQNMNCSELHAADLFGYHDDVYGFEWFLAALQLGGKRNPELQDKFIICQVPCYTEGEDSLRRTVNSLAALNYDDKRKLIFIICDGNIIGSGNDRTTPRIVLDILGMDLKLDLDPLLFKSVGAASKALNYGKVYSGLYEFEGHIIPYIVIVKVGSDRALPACVRLAPLETLLYPTPTPSAMHTYTPICATQRDLDVETTSRTQIWTKRWHLRRRTLYLLHSGSTSIAPPNSSLGGVPIAHSFSTLSKHPSYFYVPGSTYRGLSGGDGSSRASKKKGKGKKDDGTQKSERVAVDAVFYQRTDSTFPNTDDPRLTSTKM
ncbi:hypothetical protein BDZ89DRAFT_1044908 [Hymenopellis radicata]|nr:hypothetical protein BDZ89DRAFT_1044908 [Hymenopellis radicata]